MATPLLSDPASTTAADFKADDQITSIDVVGTETGPRLINGAARLAATQLNGEQATTSAASLTSGCERSRRTFVRFDLTALERAVYIADLRAVHDKKHPPAKRGRKTKLAGDEPLEE